jgi:hypothetical protein
VRQATEIRLARELTQFGRALCPWCTARAIRRTLKGEDGDRRLLEAHAGLAGKVAVA